MSKLTILLALIFSCQILFAQDEEHPEGWTAPVFGLGEFDEDSVKNGNTVDRLYKRTLFVELGGAAGFGSFNLDKLFFEKNRIKFSWRLGGIIYPGVKRNTGTGIDLVFPASLNLMYRFGTAFMGVHHLEMGLGQTLSFSTKNQFLIATINIGYRYQKKDGGFFFRAGYTPFISYLYSVQYQHWAGISIGKTFKNKTYPNANIKVPGR